jgi:hypothetical protein
MCEKYNKYSIKYVSLGFINIDVDGKDRPQCLLCMNVLAADSMNSNKLNRHLETVPC